MVEYKDSQVKYFYGIKQPRCPYKRLLPCIVNGYSMKIFVCSRNDKKCHIKNCPEYGK